MWAVLPVVLVLLRGLVLRVVVVLLPLTHGEGGGSNVEALARTVHASIVPPSQGVQAAKTIHRGRRGAPASYF